MTQGTQAPTGPLIIHHKDCPDGFGSAWWLARWLREHHREGSALGIHAAGYGDPLPDIVDGRDVFVVDFSYPREQMAELGTRANSVLVLDHHKKALEQGWGHTGFQVLLGADAMRLWIRKTHGSLPRLGAVLDMDRSGVGLVLDYIDAMSGGPQPFPTWLLNIEDRDLWRLQYPETTAVFAAVTSYPYTVAAWDALAERTIDELVVEGEPIVRYRNQVIAECVGNAYQLHMFGRLVWVAAAPYMVGSDVAGILAERDPEGFAAVYQDKASALRSWSLRSVQGSGMDVDQLARTVGGGGHAHAAGFRERGDVHLPF